MTATAIGTLVSAPGPKASAGGTAAAMVAIEVISIGRSLMGQASISASLVDNPRFLTALVKSTSRIEFFFTIPISNIRPI